MSAWKKRTLFSIGTLTAAMSAANGEDTGLALGAWGAVQATAAGAGIAFGGLLRDVVTAAASVGAFGQALAVPATGYGAVYQVEILLLFATLIAIGPLTNTTAPAVAQGSRLGLAQLPG